VSRILASPSRQKAKTVPLKEVEGHLPFRALKVALSGRTSRTQRCGRVVVSLESEYQCLEDNVLTILAAEGK
jgi:hypothetical protein